MSDKLQSAWPIGDCVYRKWRNPRNNEFWYEPYFVVRQTNVWVFVEEFMGPTYRLDKRRMQRSGSAIHYKLGAVFYADVPDEYKKQTIGYLMAEEPRSILGLPDGFTPDQLKDAYRNAVRKAHPDHGGSHDEFLKVQAAYDHLRSSPSFADILRFAKEKNSAEP